MTLLVCRYYLQVLWPHFSLPSRRWLIGFVCYLRFGICFFNMFLADCLYGNLVFYGLWFRYFGFLHLSFFYPFGTTILFICDGPTRFAPNLHIFLGRSFFLGEWLNLGVVLIYIHSCHVGTVGQHVTSLVFSGTSFFAPVCWVCLSPLVFCAREFHNLRLCFFCQLVWFCCFCLVYYIFQSIRLRCFRPEFVPFQVLRLSDDWTKFYRSLLGSPNTIGRFWQGSGPTFVQFGCRQSMGWSYWCCFDFQSFGARYPPNIICRTAFSF